MNGVSEGSPVMDGMQTARERIAKEAEEKKCFVASVARASDLHLFALFRCLALVHQALGDFLRQNFLAFAGCFDVLGSTEKHSHV